MGLDLVPWDPNEGAPAPDGTVWVHFTNHEWVTFTVTMEQLGVDLYGFPGRESMSVLTEEICIAVADALENHPDALPEADRRRWQGSVPFWRNAGGFVAL